MQPAFQPAETRKLAIRAPLVRHLRCYYDLARRNPAPLHLGQWSSPLAATVGDGARDNDSQSDPEHCK